MDVVISHVHQYLAQYAVGSALLVVALYATRRWTWGPVQWLIELVIYFGIFHVVLHYVVVLADWFHYESQMKMLVDQKVRMGYSTPLDEPWVLELYNPRWLAYFEVAAVVLIIAAMIRYRPMKTQKPLPKREALRKGVGPSVRPPMPAVRPKG